MNKIMCETNPYGNSLWPNTLYPACGSNFYGIDSISLFRRQDYSFYNSSINNVNVFTKWPKVFKPIVLYKEESNSRHTHTDLKDVKCFDSMARQIIPGRSCIMDENEETVRNMNGKHNVQTSASDRLIKINNDHIVSSELETRNNNFSAEKNAVDIDVCHGENKCKSVMANGTACGKSSHINSFTSFGVPESSKVYLPDISHGNAIDTLPPFMNDVRQSNLSIQLSKLHHRHDTHFKDNNNATQKSSESVVCDNMTPHYFQSNTNNLSIIPGHNRTDMNSSMDATGQPYFNYLTNVSSCFATNACLINKIDDVASHPVWERNSMSELSTREAYPDDRKTKSAFTSVGCSAIGNFFSNNGKVDVMNLETNSTDIKSYIENGHVPGTLIVERPFKCECGRTFARNEELVRHRRIHSGYKPHRCDICLKHFGRKDHLNKHLKTHLRICEKKTHVCTVLGCRQSYTRSDALTRHQFTAHGIAPKRTKWRPGK